jgi:phage terminase large subunit-like protein
VAYRKTMTAEEIRATGAIDRVFFGHFFLPDDFRKVSAPSHYEVNSMLNDTSYRYFGVMCHRHWAKSTFLSYTDPVHQICYNSEASPRFIVIISETQGQAINHVERIKYTIEYNERIIEFFGDKSKGRKWGSKEIVTRNNVRVAALGTGQRPRGLIEVGGMRPTRTIVDDFESKENAATPDARRENLNWLYAVVLPFKDSEIGQVYLTQSPISNDCAIFKVMDDPEWRCLKVPIYTINDQGQIMLSWPDLWSWDRIQAEKRTYSNQGLVGLFDQEYLLIPYKGEMAGITRDDIRWFTGDFVVGEMGIKYIRDFREVHEDGTPITEPRNLLITTFSSCDPALGEEKKHDQSAMLSIGMDSENNFIVFDKLGKRSNSSFYIGNTFGEFAWNARANGIGVETVAFQSAIGEVVQQWCDEHGVSFDFVRGFNPRSSKDLRINWAVNKFKAKRVFMRPEHQDVVHELLDWPGGEHDDFWDALYMGMRIGYPSSHSDPVTAHKIGSEHLRYFRKIPSHAVV